MGESSSNRPDTGETSKMESPSTDSQLVDSLSKGWTDEKHTLFLNSIESSFVNELHNGEYNSKFKVLCKESLVYNKDKKNAQLEIGSITLSANPWIRHFRSPCVVTKRNLESSDMIGNSQFTQPSPHIANEGHYGEGTEVSDQNFLDDGPISEKRSSIIGGKRKLGAAMIPDSINDQFVPSRKPLIMPISDGNHALLSTNSECSSQTSEVIPSSLLSDTKELLRDDDDEVNS
ncbi:cold-regulated protein 27-like [Curcuma longa]|uniref:cold-regulated protein 27-like n=1 Tax=Curcuma longa TaxID=136217 RepID=UPI003D9EC9E3